MNYKRIPIKKICSYTLFRKIKDHALHGLHRMNAKTADCYAFNIVNGGKEWEGGWDWARDLVDKNADYIFMLETGKLFKIN